MRDHLLGFPAITVHTSTEAEEIEEYGDSLTNYEDPYPLGIPNRVHAEGMERMKRFCGYAEENSKAAMDARIFEQGNRPYPDGTQSPAPVHWRVTSGGLYKLLGEVLQKRAKDIAKNVEHNNVMMKAISCKPAPGQAIPTEAAQEDEAQESITSAYMRGLVHGRNEQSRSMNAMAAEKAQEFERERMARMKAADANRAAFGGIVQSANPNWIQDSVRAMGLLMPPGQSDYMPGYEVLNVRAADVVQSSQFTLREASCGFVPS